MFGVFRAIIDWPQVRQQHKLSKNCGSKRRDAYWNRARRWRLQQDAVASVQKKPCAVHFGVVLLSALGPTVSVSWRKASKNEKVSER